MTRVRLREAHSPDELAKIYKEPHDHNNWLDHKLRVTQTVDLANWSGPYESAADLSCGNGSILRQVTAKKKFYGDLAPGYTIAGPIEKTLATIPNVDLFILSETLEHLDNPDFVLTRVRDKTSRLVLSTPIDETDKGNEEHYWGWGTDDIEQMLRTAGFNPVVLNVLDFRNRSLYDFQIWGCE